MLRNVTPRTRTTVNEYRFTMADTLVRGAAIAFDCDAAGVILNPLALADCAIANLMRGLWSGRFAAPVVEVFQVTKTTPMSGMCVCRARLHLYDAQLNECERCGRMYNGFGQELAPPAQWGEETGERFTDAGVEVL